MRLGFFAMGIYGVIFNLESAWELHLVAMTSSDNDQL